MNKRTIEREIERLRRNLGLNKERIATLRNQVNSRQYGPLTLQELKEEEREYEANQMRIKHFLSMLQRMKGQKDEAMTKDAYPVVHREGDFKVVQSDEGFEVYYLGIYHDTFHTKEQALGFIKKFNDRAKARKKTNDADEQWITMKGTHVKIEEGQSKAEAAKNFIKKKGGNPAPAKSKETAAPAKSKATPKAETKSFQEKGRTGTPKQQSKEELEKNMRLATQMNGMLQLVTKKPMLKL